MIALVEPSGTPELTLVPRTRPCSRCGGPRQEGRKDAYCPPCRKAYRREHIGASRAYNRRSEARRRGVAIPRHMYRDCLDCGEPLPLGTRVLRCWECRQAHVTARNQMYRRAAAERDPERERERNRRYRRTHREEINARARARHAANPEKMREYNRQYRARKRAEKGQVRYRTWDGRKRCPECGDPKPLTEFYRYGQRIVAYCKPCWRAYNRRNREHRAAQSST